MPAAGLDGTQLPVRLGGAGSGASEHRILAVVLVDILLSDHVRRRQLQLGKVGGKLAFERPDGDVDRGAGDEVGIVEPRGAVLAFLDEGKRLLLAVRRSEDENVRLPAS